MKMQKHTWKPVGESGVQTPRLLVRNGEKNWVENAYEEETAFIKEG